MLMWRRDEKRREELGSHANIKLGMKAYADGGHTLNEFEKN